MRAVGKLILISFAALPALAASQRCSQCHPRETAGYEQSPMAHSLTEVTAQPEGSFEHALSKTTFTIHVSPSGMTQTLVHDGQTETHRVAYVIGSGAHAYGYLVLTGGGLFQSPISYYTTRHVWDVAPGYEQSARPDFSRPVTVECLVCHSGKPQPVPNTLNRYRTPAFLEEGISCERCHGPTEAHEKNPVPGSILNPAKLNGAARDSICEQCHLAGEVRIPNPGKSIADFQPGRPLEDAFTIYLAPRSSSAGLKVISQSEQLALSACARKSGGRLWCGTCHNPHQTPAQPAAYYRERCLGCHAATLDKAHAAPGRDCVSCHMPRLPARDGGHTAFTDHGIAARPLPGKQDDLIAWREPDPRFRDRNLAIALVSVGLENSDAQQVIRGYLMLNKLEKQFPDDPALLSTLGTVLLRAKQPAEALLRFEKVLRLQPGYPPYEKNAALARAALAGK